MSSENSSSGKKYQRTIRDLNSNQSVTVDVYSVLVAFGVTCPARAHAIKKLLCSGIRGKGDVEQDLREARDAVMRSIGLMDVEVKVPIGRIKVPALEMLECPQCNLEWIVGTEQEASIRVHGICNPCRMGVSKSPLNSL